jgi:carbamoyl-phosphate synthase small subunit
MTMLRLANLVLEDGTCLQGSAVGAEADAMFELVFNTSMTGYQEILTDPSYRGQGVLFTASHIGNVGVNPEDCESRCASNFGCCPASDQPVVSNWRASSSAEVLGLHGVPGSAGWIRAG